jgi:PPM family protein phosphatase
MTETSGIITTTVAGFTDVGMVRTNNEDNFLIADLKTGRVFLIPQRIGHKLDDNRVLLAVSDGVGGANSGEIASSMAVHSMRVELLRRTKTPVSPFDRLVQAVEKANSLIWAEGQANPERRGMGATITAALIEKNVAYIAEVGDSRGYIIHSGRIKQVTTDQSLVGLLVERGMMSPEQAETAPGRNIILQSLGCQAEIKVAVSSLELTAGDYLLLCSDGLSGKVKSEEILDLVQNSGGLLDNACKQMIELAKQRGGEDNITVILAKFEGDSLKPPEFVARLTTHIEVLAAFDPESAAEKKYKKNQDSKKGLSDPKKTLDTKKELKPLPEAPAAAVAPPPPQPATTAAPSAAIVPDDRSTKLLSSDKSKKEGTYLHTLGASGQIMPSRYTPEQLLRQNEITNDHLAMAIESINKQIEYFQSLLYWAEKSGKETGELDQSLKRLEQLLQIIEENRLKLDEANRFVELFAE